MPHPVGLSWCRSTAAFAALMLLVQLFVGGFAVGGAAADSPMLDAFGNPLCITNSDAQSGDEERSHTGLPDCCAPGCSMFAPATSADRAPMALSNPLEGRTGPAIVPDVAPVAASPDHDPGNPRAPPLQV